jgi:hypothetical protein
MGLLTECDNRKDIPLFDGDQVYCVLHGKQELLNFNRASDGEYWWTDSSGKEAEPSHYTLSGVAGIPPCFIDDIV